MEVYIRKDRLLQDAQQESTIRQNLAGIVDISNLINDQPTADVAPVAHARWVPADYKPYYYSVCTRCGRRIEALAKEQYPYCPGCGAKMDLDPKSPMTKKELWLKLFRENDTALASAIHLCKRFVTLESLEQNQDFINQKKAELYEEVPQNTVNEVFGGKE